MGRGDDDTAIPGSYITILQPTVTPYELLSTVLRGFKPTFTYGTIFVGFAVDRVPDHKATELRLDPRVLKVVENRIVTDLTREGLVEILQTKYTVVNRETGELYDVREIDGSLPVKYSILPGDMVPSRKARSLLGINDVKTAVPNKAARVMGHNAERQLVPETQNQPFPSKAARMLGIQPVRKQSFGAGGAAAAGAGQSHHRKSDGSSVESASSKRRPSATPSEDAEVVADVDDMDDLIFQVTPSAGSVGEAKTYLYDDDDEDDFSPDPEPVWRQGRS